MNWEWRPFKETYETATVLERKRKKNLRRIVGASFQMRDTK